MKQLLTFLFIFVSIFSGLSQIDENLLLQYNFTNEAEDVSGNEHHGQTFGGTSLTNDCGNVAFQLDGINDYIQVDSDELGEFYHQPFSVSFWVKKLASSNSWTNTFAVSQWGQGSVTSGENQWTISLSDDGFNNKPVFSVETGTTRYSAVSTSEIELSEWCHIVGVYSGSSISLYVNGELEQEISTGSSPINSSGRNLKIGVNDTGTSNLFSNMVIDDLRIYSKALTSDDIAELFTLPEDLPVAHYTFVDNADDVSGNGHHGQMFGATQTVDHFGTPNSAYLLDGIDDYIQVDYDELGEFYHQPFSVSVWVKKLAPSVNWTNTFAVSQWGQGSVTSGGNQWTISLSDDGSNNKPVFSVEEGTTIYSAVSTSEITLSEWYHIVGVYSGSSISLYVNGEFIQEVETSSFPINSAGRNLMVGVNDGGTSIIHTEMAIDDLEIYCRALSSDEISELFEITSIAKLDTPENDINIYPNPTGNYLFIEAKDDVQIDEIIIYNSNGEKEFVDRFDSKIIFNLPNGMYFLKLLDKKGKTLGLKKFVVIKNK